MEASIYQDSGGKIRIVYHVRPMRKAQLKVMEDGKQIRAARPAEKIADYDKSIRDNAELNGNMAGFTYMEKIDAAIVPASRANRAAWRLSGSAITGA